MRRGIAAAILFLWAASFAAQMPKQEFTDAKALLDAVANTYAQSPDSFHIEAIEETVQKSELEDDRRTIYRTAIQGPGNLYRIDTRSAYGSYTLVSDGTSEWMYLAETKMYVERPFPQNWPGFPKIATAGDMELRNAWDMRTFLEADIAKSEHATMLPQETITIGGKSYSCYVVRATLDSDKEAHSEFTFWIDKKALVVRKRFTHSDSYLIATKEIHLPWHSEITTVFPVTDFGSQTDMSLFRFTPPADAKKMASLDPQLSVPLPNDHPKAQMAGQMAPDVTLTRADGSKVALSSLRGKPVLMDFWATWCGPCLVAMPVLHRVYDAVKDKGIGFLVIDEDNRPDDATAYLARHKYPWTDFHDTDSKLQKAFKSEGIPLTVLIDGQGKIVYYDFGGNEETLRRAIAGLGPEFASVAPATAGAASESTKKN